MNDLESKPFVIEGHTEAKYNNVILDFGVVAFNDD